VDDRYGGWKSWFMWDGANPDGAVDAVWFLSSRRRILPGRKHIIEQVSASLIMRD
jgi:hypothetical protein